MNKGITSKLVVFLVVFLEIVAEIQSAPVSNNKAAKITCPRPTGFCRGDPEEPCKNDAECSHLNMGSRVHLCCPHACKGKKICIDFNVPQPTTANPPTTVPSTKAPTTVVSTATSTEKPSSTQEPSPTAPRTSARITTEQTSTSGSGLPTEEVEITTSKPTTAERLTTTQMPSTTEATTSLGSTTSSKPMTVVTTTLKHTTTERPTTTQIPTSTESTTTEKSTTNLPSTTAPTTRAVTIAPTTEFVPGPSACGHSKAKDILFIIDSAYSYQQHRATRRKEWKQVKHFVKEMISELEGDRFRIGVMQYGGYGKPWMEVELSDGVDTSSLKRQIDDMKQVGGTKKRVGEALAVAGNKFYEFNTLYDREDAQDVVVLITRDRPTDREQAVAEAEMLKRKGVQVVTVGVSLYPWYLAQSVGKMSSFKHDAITCKYSELADKKMDLLEKICMSVNLPGVVSLCRNKKVDVQFLLDGSRSINQGEFDKKRKFLKDVFFLIESPPSDLHTGLMQFSTVEKTEHLFQLEKHTLPEELNAIINMQYHSGRNTMLGDALSQINNEVFNGQAGDRSTVENVLVIFSDGRAHDISRAYREAGYMKEKDVRIIATAVSDSGYIPEELRRLATHRKDVLAIDLSNTAHYAKELASMICKANA